MSNLGLPMAPANGLYAIADVARETGVQKDTLRVWERRYGFPTPQRDASGERRYDAEQVQRLHLIKRLLDAGCRPGGVVCLPREALEQRLSEMGAAPGKTARANRPRPLPAPLAWSAPAAAGLDTSRWLNWVRGGDVDSLHQALTQHALKHGLLQTVDGLLGPLGRAVGEAWWAGDVTVYQEHLYSEAVQRFLQDAVQKAQQPNLRQAPRVLLTTLPGEQHTLGLLMAECMLALEGCERFALGRDTPLTDVVAAAQQWQVDVLALSISAHAPAAEVWSGLKVLAGALPAQVAIWVGGASPHLRRGGMPEGVVVMQSVGEIALRVQQWRGAAGTG